MQVISTAWTVEVWFKKSSNKSGHNFTNKAQIHVAGDWSLETCSMEKHE